MNKLSILVKAFSCRAFLVLALMGFFLSVSAEDSQVDQLRLIWAWEVSPTAKLESSLKLLNKLKIDAAFSDSVMRYGILAEELAKKLELPKKAAKAQTILGYTLAYKIGNYEKAKRYYHDALDYHTAQNDSLWMASIYNDLGNICRTQGLFSIAIQHFENSEEIRLAIDPKNKYNQKELGKLHNNLGIVYEQNDQPELAKKQYLLSLKYKQQMNNAYAIANAYNNLASVSKLMGQNDSCRFYLAKTFNFFDRKVIEDSLLLADAFMLNAALFEKEGAYKKALVLNKKALSIYKSRDEKLYMAKAYMSIGSNYEYLQEYDEALDTYQKGLDNMEDKNSGVLLTQIYKTRSNLIQENQRIKEVKDARIFASAISIAVILILISSFGTWHFRESQRKTVQLLVADKKRHNQKIIALVQEKETEKETGFLEGMDQQRTYIAGELHDNLAGHVAGVKQFFQLLMEYIPSNAEMAAKLSGKVLNSLDQIYHETRLLSHQLVDADQDYSYQHLFADFQAYLENLKELDIDFILYPMTFSDEKINYTRGLQIKRIMQETITNVIKHSDAKETHIRMNMEGRFFKMVIKDDGKGFDKNAKEGFGLTNIRKRTRKLMGDCKIESKIGRGTRVQIKIPKSLPVLAI